MLRIATVRLIPKSAISPGSADSGMEVPKVLVRLALIKESGEEVQTAQVRKGLQLTLETQKETGPECGATFYG